jgi:hypothetical protein
MPRNAPEIIQSYCLRVWLPVPNGEGAMNGLENSEGKFEISHVSRGAILVGLVAVANIASAIFSLVMTP